MKSVPLPKGWQELQIKDVCLIYYGKGLGKNNMVDGDIPVYSSGGIIGFHNESIINSQGIIIGRKGNAGSVFYSSSPFFCIDTAFYVEANNNIDLKFLYYKLISCRLERYKIDSAVPGINRDTIYSIFLTIPPIDEQKRIAEVLSLCDDVIENLTKLIEKKELYKKGVMQRVLSGEVRFNGFKDEWKIKKLSEISKSIKTGKLDANAMEENGQYRFYTCAREYYRINEYAFDGEALLISGNGAYVGYVHYYKGKFNAYQRTYVLMDFEEDIKYIKYYLDRYLKERIKKEKNEGNTPYIVLSTLTDMEIKVPILEEQKKIAGLLSVIDEEIDNLKKQLELRKQQKKGLMQRLLSGDVRI
ncbi:type I R-M system specificity subunit [Brachyspira hampsonii]|uniref:Type I R-M system specificity subunit n=1 Tax=Brachyspira hampsonii TaxID=1287055 RepID=A0A1E5NFL7_9SPIR|nr:restriction endonuclease subunit S [Brachyspira hampsonii]OEJ14931.1 type I R-M system specificity subunit [Brachyspira hampsonii]